MPHQPILPYRSRVVAAITLVLMLLIAAAVNVPWAVTFMQSRESVRNVPMATVSGEEARRDWPSRPPHEGGWPRPEYWSEGSIFGCRVYDVRAAEGPFNMSVHHLGWPLPVIEQKQMLWDWNNPALAGPESDPSPSLVLRGLVLNPIMLGGGAWVVLVLPYVGAVIATRRYRRRRGRCLDCGYPAKSGSESCTECGSRL
jgi:hypothetical protein